MTKAELLQEVQSMTDVPQATVKRVVDALLQTIGDRVGAGDEVPLPPLGRFVVVERKERMGKNLSTGESMVIPAHRAVRFKPAKALKEKVQ
jgi:DNA-binding protein HU-beta